METLETMMKLFVCVAGVAVIAVAVAAWLSLLGRRFGAALALAPLLVGAVLVFALFTWNFLGSAADSLSTVGNHQGVEQ